MEKKHKLDNSNKHRGVTDGRHIDVHTPVKHPHLMFHRRDGRPPAK